MTPFSARYALPLALLLAAFLVPIAQGRLVEPRDDCSSLEALLDAKAFDPASAVISRGPRATSIEKERLTARVERTGAPSLLYSVVRTRGLPALLLQPAEGLPGDREPDEVERATLETADGPLTVRYAYERREGVLRATAWFMTLADRSISSPFLGRLRDAPGALIHGPHRVTLFVASTDVHTSERDAARTALDDWMRGAYQHYRAVCSR